MPRRLGIGNAQDLVQAERDIRERVGGQRLDFAAMAAVSTIDRPANAIRHHMEQQVLAEEDLALVSARLSGRDKNQLATLLRKIIRTVEDED